jgi:hypothetical protein
MFQRKFRYTHSLSGTIESDNEVEGGLKPNGLGSSVVKGTNPGLRWLVM